MSHISDAINDFFHNNKKTLTAFIESFNQISVYEKISFNVPGAIFSIL